MSDFILKFWPEKETNSDQTTKLKKELIKSQIIGEKTDFLEKPAYKAGKMLNNFLEPKLQRNNSYFETIAITIEEKNYGVIEGNEDFEYIEYIDRMNVISIKGGEGAFNKWNEMCKKLEEITGNKYQGGWELL